jgi:hypothetical protein
MTLIVTSEFELNRVASPALPLAPEAYNRSYQDQLNNVLRLYFNRVDSILGALQPVETINTISFTVYTVVTLPSAVTLGAGTRAFVSDANATTFASIVAGGGSDTVPVYSDGTDWRIG